MVRNASGLFIWAATAYRFIRDGKRFAAKRLDIILHSSGSTTTAPEKHLDEIYTTALKQSISPEYSDEEKGKSYQMLRLVLGSVVILFTPLSIYSISRILCVRKEENMGLTAEVDRLVRVNEKSSLVSPWQQLGPIAGLKLRNHRDIVACRAFTPKEGCGGRIRVSQGCESTQLSNFAKMIS